jgi:hypothetical protein
MASSPRRHACSACMLESLTNVMTVWVISIIQSTARQKSRFLAFFRFCRHNDEHPHNTVVLLTQKWRNHLVLSSSAYYSSRLFRLWLIYERMVRENKVESDEWR